MSNITEINVHFDSISAYMECYSLNLFKPLEAQILNHVGVSCLRGLYNDNYLK